MNEGITLILNKYAVAVLQLGEKHNLLDKIKEDLYLVKEIVVSNTDLQQFISHPLINSADHKDVLEKIFKEHVSEITLNFVKLLADNGRLSLLPHMADYYYKLLCQLRNIDTAKVITAVPIDANTINRVKQKLEMLFNKKINVESYVEKDIIAGVIVKIKDKIIDGSIRTRFDNMKKQFLS